MAHASKDSEIEGVWFIDSGCSHHMSGARLLFKDLDETKKKKKKIKGPTW